MRSVTQAKAPWGLLGQLADLTRDRNDRARHSPDVPKAQRRPEPRGPQRAMVDCQATLGHPPRPRRRTR